MISALLVLGVLVSAQPEAHAAPVPLEVGDGVTELQGVSPTLPDAELAPFLKLVARGQIIGIGESAHGSQGYEELQWRLVQAAIKRKLVHGLYFEQPVLKFRWADAYVRGVSSDFTRVALELDRFKQNKTFVEFLHWLRKHNQKLLEDDRVGLYGVDLWDEPWAARASLEKALRAIQSKDALALIEPMRAHCFGMKYDSWPPFLTSPEYIEYQHTLRLEPKAFEQCSETLSAIGRWIDRFRAKIASQIGPKATLDTVLTVHSRKAWQECWNTMLRDFRRSQVARDSAMAKLVYITQDFLTARFTNGAKALLVAHNVHIAKKMSEAFPPSGTSWSTWRGIPSAGEYLKGWFDQGYVAIGLTGFEVSNRFERYPLPEREDSLDRLLHERKLRAAWVDPSGTLVQSRKEWWLHAESAPSGFPLRVSSQYDALVFVDVSPAPEPLVRLQGRLQGRPFR